MAAIVVAFAYVDPDSVLPASRLLVGFYVDGRHVSVREAREAHKRGERVETRRIERPEIPLREG